MKKTVLLFLFTIITGAFALSPSSAKAQDVDYLTYTGQPDEKIERLVRTALKEEYDWFYKEFSYVPYMQYATTDLNGDGKPEIVARFIEEYAFIDEQQNVNTYIFAYTSKGLFKIFDAQAIDIAIGKKDSSGLREIVAFKGLNRNRYDVYKWDGKRRYIKK
jgi:hypothetical protein